MKISLLLWGGGGGLQFRDVKDVRVAQMFFLANIDIQKLVKLHGLLYVNMITS